MKIFNLLLAAAAAQDFDFLESLANKANNDDLTDLIKAMLNGPTEQPKFQEPKTQEPKIQEPTIQRKQKTEEVLAAGSSRPVRGQRPKPETSFDKDPTDGVRPCNFYTYVAEADFTIGAGPATGKIKFTQETCKDGVKINGLLTMKGKMTGKRKFGWHIHEFGSTDKGCGEQFTGGHFNPY